MRGCDGNVSLYLQRQDAKTVRAMQSLLRTLTARLGLHMGNLGKGWLELCTEEEMQLASHAESGASDAASAPCVHETRLRSIAAVHARSERSCRTARPRCLYPIPVP